ncbi:MAG: tRNA (adenosine(37)-N6)-threonylcarbamoyltransferase complex dimerization subunit type 1 TsaB [Thermoguttaceae bacterium]
MMKILAFETMETHGSVAAFENDTLLSDVKLLEKSAKSLAPAISDLMKNVGWKSTDIDYVAVATGPGSFTGLRVGVATAKVFAYATGAKVVGVDTLQAAAFSILSGANEKTRPRFCVVSSAVDAQRGEVVVQNFSATLSESAELVPLTEPKIVPASDWLEQVNEKDDQPICFTGPALFKIKQEKFHVKHCNVIADQTFWYPDASVIGRLAQIRIRNGESDDIWALSPIYSRLSAAEEKKIRTQ